MNNKKIIIGFSIITLLLLTGGIYLLSTTVGSPVIIPSQNVKVDISEKTFDWGQIPYYGDKATKAFTIKNTGTDILKLSNIKTSCTCTKAQVEIKGKLSPFFNMHSTSSWVGEILPGQEGKLTVIFDQAFHGPQGVGPIERLVSVETNDVQNPKLEFSLKGVVVK